jgi:hypothetical protein
MESALCCCLCEPVARNAAPRSLMRLLNAVTHTKVNCSEGSGVDDSRKTSQLVARQSLTTLINPSRRQQIFFGRTK